jgi:hypothetical protein
MMQGDVLDQQLREEATTRLRKRREFATHLAAYSFVNVSVIVIWMMTGSGFFWPAFLILGWGIGLFFHGWDTFARPLSETRIEQEMERLQRSRRRCGTEGPQGQVKTAMPTAKTPLPKLPDRRVSPERRVCTSAIRCATI